MRCAKHKVKLGFDPEFFLRDKDEGFIVSADEVLPRRDDPRSFEGRRRSKHSVKLFADGVQAEINTTNTPSCRHHTSEEQSMAMEHVIDFAEENDLTVDISAAVELDADELDFLSDYARQFGCDPAYNAWADGDEIDAPRGERHPVRYAGGHLHFGKYKSAWKYLFDESNVQKMVQMMDYFVSLPMTMLFGGEDFRLRRRGYGKAGSYRITEHGFEYRTPGPYWLMNTAFSHFAFGQARSAISVVDSGDTDDVKSIVDPAEVIDAINDADRKRCGQLWKKVQPYLQNRVAERQSSGTYFRCLDIISAVGPDTFTNPTECTYWGSLCKNVSQEYPDMLAEHEHGRVYLETDDFKTQEAVTA